MCHPESLLPQLGLSTSSLLPAIHLYTIFIPFSKSYRKDNAGYKRAPKITKRRYVVAFRLVFFLEGDTEVGDAEIAVNITLLRNLVFLRCNAVSFAVSFTWSFIISKALPA